MQYQPDIVESAIRVTAVNTKENKAGESPKTVVSFEFTQALINPNQIHQMVGTFQTITLGNSKAVCRIVDAHTTEGEDGKPKTSIKIQTSEEFSNVATLLRSVGKANYLVMETLQASFISSN